MDLTNLKRINGYYRPRAVQVAANELYTKDPINISVRNSGDEHQKVFCYSKVVNARTLVDKCKLNFVPEPWLNCIAIDDLVVAYIWDTRVIIAVDKNSAAAKALRDTPWEQCVPDFYNAFDNKPMLVNPNKVACAEKALSLAKGWVQPWIHVTVYKTTEPRGMRRLINYDIVTNMPGQGELLIGEINMQEGNGGQFKYSIEYDRGLCRDVWPKLRKGSDKPAVGNGLVQFQTIQRALLDLLVS